jgi:hypothetical protein
VLPMAWFLTIMVGLILYVTLDGSDLVVGILAISRRDDSPRQELLELWYWSVTGRSRGSSWSRWAVGRIPCDEGGALLAAVYLPIVVML